MKHYDVAVVGGGPAGMMAALRAGELGARVILLEKNQRLGIKLLATGGGRCNLTNQLEDKKEFAGRLGLNGKFLFSALHRFGPEETMDFFKERGLPLRVEGDKRVFPKSGQAADVLKILSAYLKESKVEVRLDSPVKALVKTGDKIEKIVLAGGGEIRADKYIITTGGRSYPATGSSGDGYEWLKKLGHTVVPVRPALAPVLIKNFFIKNLEGLSLSNIGIGVYAGNKKIIKKIGDLLFTAGGLSGPAILDLSRVLSGLPSGGTEIRLDFFPDLTEDELDKKIQGVFRAGNNKLLKNVLAGLVPARLFSVLADLLKIDGDKPVNTVARPERRRLVELFKNFSLVFNKVAGFDQAMVTAGGLDLKEVDPKTMRSKIVDNLFLAGEILDLDGPTGGFNL